MFVDRLFVRNFRSLERVNTSFKPGLNILVGKNNAGKSNIIRALDYVLGETWPTARNIEIKDFYRNSVEDAPRDSFLIAVGISGTDINIDLLSSIEKKVNLVPIHPAPSWDNIDYFLEDFPQFWSKNWVYYEELGRQLIEAEKIVLFLAVPKEGKKKERVLGLLYEKQGHWVGVKNFVAALRDALLTTAYIPSFRDPSSQFRVNQYSWYGKLIQYLYNCRTEEQKSLIHNAQSLQAEVLREIFENTTESLRTSLKQAVFHHGISFIPGTNTQDDEHKQITLFVDDGLNTPFYEKGSGIQSALIMALFSLYCEYFHGGSSLLLAEEPELYLHPQARRAIEAQLFEFVQKGQTEEGNSAHQVILSTHSPEFLRSTPMEQVTVVRRPRGQVNTVALQTKKSLPKAQQALQTKNVELLFADHVILVEGGEEYILPPLADLHFEQRNWLDFQNTSVIRVNGKGSFTTYVQILKEFGIPWTILTDLDFLQDEVVKFRDLLQPVWQEVESLRAEMKQSIALSKGKEIKEKVFSPEVRDWQSIYSSVNALILDIRSGERLTEERISEMTNLWSSLSDRVHKPNDDSYVNDEVKKQKLNQVLQHLREKNIFVLSRGELEDYLSPEGMQLGGSKDTRALEVGGKLLECQSIKEASRWMIIEEFIEMLKTIEVFYQG